MDSAMRQLSLPLLIHLCALFTGSHLYTLDDDEALEKNAVKKVRAHRSVLFSFLPPFHMKPFNLGE